MTTGGSTGGSYYEQPSQQGQLSSSSATSDSYSPAATGAHGPSYTYYYQHYPHSSSAVGGHGWQGGVGGDEGGYFPGFGGLDFPGFGGNQGVLGVGGLKVLKVLKIIAKGILVVKPFLILGLLLLIAIPVLLLLLPIPIITITGQPTTFRSGKSAQLTSYLTQLTGKVLNAEECLERVICKLPQPPEKYQTKAKLIWDQYGSRIVTHPRMSRGLNAYFDSSSETAKQNRNLKCDQKFKCSNKYL